MLLSQLERTGQNLLSMAKITCPTIRPSQVSKQPRPFQTIFGLKMKRLIQQVYCFGNQPLFLINEPEPAQKSGKRLFITGNFRVSNRKPHTLAINVNRLGKSAGQLAQFTYLL